MTQATIDPAPAPDGTPARPRSAVRSLLRLWPYVRPVRVRLFGSAVLILDEATSSLDVPGERAVQHAMRTVLHGRTAVIIAHRLSTVEIADRILVMEAGRIVEDGTPAGLVADDGRFAGLQQAWRDSVV